MFTIFENIVLFIIERPEIWDSENLFVYLQRGTETTN